MSLLFSLYIPTVVVLDAAIFWNMTVRPRFLTLGPSLSETLDSVARLRVCRSVWVPLKLALKFSNTRPAAYAFALTALVVIGSWQ